MRVLCVLAKHNYGNPVRGEGYEFVNFLPALKRLGHEVLFFDPSRRDLYNSFGELNRALLTTIEVECPDVVLAVQMHYEIWLETWALIRAFGAVTINWTTDDSWRYSQFSRLIANAFDVVTTTYPDALAKYRAEGIKHVLLTQWAASDGMLRPPLQASECTIPVSFVGTAHGNRPAWIAALGKRGVTVQCFGYGWPRGPVTAERIPEIIRTSVISLNFANSMWTLEGGIPRRSRQIKARTFEVPGAGGFLLTEEVPGINKYLIPKKEIETFRTVDEAADKVQLYLGNPARRDEIARAGHERIACEHTYDSRLKELLAFALGQGKKSGEAKLGKPINWTSFEALAAKHRAGPAISFGRKVLTAAFSIFFGRRRGPRAARRVVFELSWRFAGSNTYTAKGLPGRMFYRES